MKCLMKKYIMKWIRVNAGLFVFAAGLYLTAMAAHKKALALFQISDHIFTGEALSAAERQDGFREMMEVALKTASRVKLD